jgi:hypothetical protein
MAPPFLASTLDEGERSDPSLCSFIPVETSDGTHCIGGWVGPKAGLEAVEKRKISRPCQES